MKQFQVAYVPIGVPTYHQESANQQFDTSVRMIKDLTDAAVFPAKPLLSVDELKVFLDTLSPDLLILQNTTFANGAYATELIKTFDCPVLLWTVREPVIDGGRLRLNSLTGAYSAANAMHHLGRPDFEYIFGSPDEAAVKAKVGAVIRAVRVKKDLRSLNIAAIGHTPQGFGFGRALDADVARAFGSNLESVEAREFMTKAKSYKNEEYQAELAEARAVMVGLDKLPAENVDAFARLYKAYKDFVETKQIRAIASRCWPDYFVEYGTPVCAVLGMLNDLGVAASCEADLYGAISMYIGAELSGSPVFFGDPVSMNETENTITYWHCGTAACSLARQDTGAAMGVHPNRKIGPTMEFGCKAADKVTVFRVGRKPDGKFRFFVSSGAALDKPKQFNGTSVVFQPQMSAADLVDQTIHAGWEPHFILVYADVAEELLVLARMLGMEICRY